MLLLLLLLVVVVLLLLVVVLLLLVVVAVLLCWAPLQSPQLRCGWLAAVRWLLPRLPRALLPLLLWLL